jgi:very-short-patch-repair endonuclease
MDRKDPIAFARDLRRTSTSSEEYLWQLLRTDNAAARSFADSIPLDLTRPISSASQRDWMLKSMALLITRQGKEKDDARDAWMLSQGIEVLRFTGQQVELETQQVLDRIDQILRERCQIEK